jgi:hypothetical protein
MNKTNGNSFSADIHSATKLAISKTCNCPDYEGEEGKDTQKFESEKWSTLLNLNSKRVNRQKRQIHTWPEAGS